MIGIDGTKEGWIAAKYTGERWKLNFEKKLSELFYGEALIDIPIGLPEKQTRSCDQRVRQFLSPERHYSVFNCPVRDAVYSKDYQEACKINEEKTGKGISKQSWNIVPKIREADKEALKNNLMESHPELFFKILSQDSVQNSKKSDQGFRARLDVLEKHGDTSMIETFTMNKDITRDDLIDAMVLSLGSKFELVNIPEDPKNDTRGHQMAIKRPKI